MNIPNILTVIRLILVPIFALTFFSNNPNSFQLSITIFFIAGFTDILDGYIARKFNMITKIGTVVDPLADKLMLLTVLSCLLIKMFIPLWVLIIMLIKELSMILIGTVLYKKNIIIPANIFGKLASLLFYIAIFFIISNFKIYKIFVGKVLIYIAVLSALIAFTNYIIVYFKNITKSYPS